MMLTRRRTIEGNRKGGCPLRARGHWLVIQIGSLALAASFTGSALAQGPGLTLLPGFQTVGIGDPFQLSVGINGLGGPPSLGGYDLSVEFNPLFAFTSLTFGDPGLGDQLDLEGFGTFQASTPTPGAIEITELSFDDPTVLDATQARSFTMATLTFRGLGIGSGTFSFSGVTLSDSVGNAISPASLGTANVNVVAFTPEPSPFILFTLALAFLVFVCGARVGGEALLDLNFHVLRLTGFAFGSQSTLTTSEKRVSKARRVYRWRDDGNSAPSRI
jgi:hypothetical protein